MIRNTVMFIILFSTILMTVQTQAKLREPLPFEDNSVIHVFEAEPEFKADDPKNKDQPVYKAHVHHPEKVNTQGKFYNDHQSLVMVLSGFENVPVSIDYLLGDAMAAGEYRWSVSLAIGGKAKQKIEVFAGPDESHLTLRGTIHQVNKKSWANQWMTCDKPVHLDAKDKIVRYQFTGAATHRKIIDAMVLEPLAQ